MSEKKMQSVINMIRKYDTCISGYMKGIILMMVAGAVINTEFYVRPDTVENSETDDEKMASGRILSGMTAVTVLLMVTPLILGGVNCTRSTSSAKAKALGGVVVASSLVYGILNSTALGMDLVDRDPVPIAASVVSLGGGLGLAGYMAMKLMGPDGDMELSKGLLTDLSESS